MIYELTKIYLISCYTFIIGNVIYDNLKPKLIEYYNHDYSSDIHKIINQCKCGVCEERRRLNLPPIH